MRLTARLYHCFPLALAIFLCSCSAHERTTTLIVSSLAPKTDPPVVAVSGVGSGQAIVVGDALLTVTHVLSEPDSQHDTAWLRVGNSDYKYSIIATGGDTEHLTQFDAIAADWTALRLGTSPEVPGSRIEIESRPLWPGMPVSLIRATGEGRFHERLDTRVGNVADVAGFPESIVFLTPESFVSAGWSGSFVGTQPAGGSAWRLIGMVSASVSATATDSGEEGRVLVVVRPPREVLEWLVSGGANALE